MKWEAEKSGAEGRQVSDDTAQYYLQHLGNKSLHGPFPYQENGGNDTCLAGWLWGPHEIMSTSS